MKNKALVWTVVLSLIAISGYVAYKVVQNNQAKKKGGLLSNISSGDVTTVLGGIAGLFKTTGTSQISQTSQTSQPSHISARIIDCNTKYIFALSVPCLKSK